MKKNLDKIIALAGLIAGLAILYVTFQYNVGYGLCLTLILTCIFYLKFSRFFIEKEPASYDSLNDKNCHQIGPLLVTILTILTFMALIILVRVSQHSYGRPLSVFIFMALLAGIIALQIIFRERSNRLINRLLMIQISLLALTTFLTCVYTYDVTGSDIFVHKSHIDAIAITGSIDAVTSSYRNYPLYHTLGAIFSLMTLFHSSTTIIIISIVPFTLVLWFLYLLTKAYFSTTVALLAALLLSGIKWFLFWGGYPVPMSIAIAIYVLLLHLILRYHARYTIEIILLFMIFTFFMVFAHPLGAIAIVLLFLSVALPFQIYKVSRVSEKLKLLSENTATLCIGMSLIAITATLANWIYNGSTFENALREIYRNMLVSGGVLSAGPAKSILFYELDNINIYFIYFFAGVGLLLWIKNRENIERRRAVVSLMLISPAIIFLLIGYTLWIISIPLVSHRCIFLALISLMVPASYAFLQIMRNATVRNGIFACIIITLFFFSGVINTEYNIDSPLYNKQLAVYNLRSSEWNAVQFSTQKVPNTLDYGITVDEQAGRHLEFLRMERHASRHRWRSEGFIVKTTHFLIRNIYYTRVLFPDKPLNTEVALALNNTPGVNRVYENNQVALYYQTNRPLLSR